MTDSQGLLAAFSPVYVERCRVVRLRRRHGQMGADARRLERGDFYAWREGMGAEEGRVRVSLISEPRTVYIADDRIWWVPRLDQLLQRLEFVARGQAGNVAAVRAAIAQQLANRLHDAEGSWEETALDLLLAGEASAR